ncbi:MAG: YitT family protein [Peptostreptococcaceae bacterium]|nr:YitT family protein [Peptostreptococcaceae bacterium]MDY5739767.1 YitT family protein [Anaerovoracaceae bacterium]SFE02906.1 Uncharacterized membrane-anchored protein YitT, contains DUF161 and DUF2179 domains [Peptostreptococcaceae bacterium pGA-8]
MNKSKFEPREYVFITLGIFIITTALYFFMIPGKLVIGGVAGLSLVLVNFLPFEMSLMTLILNVVLLLLGFVLLGREFGAKTVYASVLLPFFLFIYEKLIPDVESLTGDMLSDMLCCIIIIGMGQAMLFHSNASSGGLDIVAKILNKYLHIAIGTAVTISGGLIVLSSVFAYEPKTCVIGLLGTYLNGIMVDYFINGFTRKIRVCILSKHFEEIQRFIVKDINRGVTLYPARGGHSNKEITELVSILDKTEYAELLHFMREKDPDAFITISTVNEVVGLWNRKSGLR